MKDISPHDNQALIPSERPAKQTGKDALTQFDFSEKEKPQDGRFDILLATNTYHSALASATLANKAAGKVKKAENKYTTDVKNISKAQDAEMKVKVSGENYQQLYAKKQQEIKEALIARSNAKRAQETQKAEEQRQNAQETMHRVKARDLATQIDVWKREIGSGNYDEHHVKGMISDLESQLNGIDPKYWS